MSRPNLHYTHYPTYAQSMHTGWVVSPGEEGVARTPCTDPRRAFTTCERWFLVPIYYLSRHCMSMMPGLALCLSCYDTPYR